MNVLHITPALSSNIAIEFTKKTSGLGYMVYDIATELSKHPDVNIDVLFYRGIYKEIVQGKCRFVSMNVWTLFSFFRFQKTLMFLSFYKKYGKDKKAFKNILYDYIALGYISYVIKHGRYDIIHIHGCSYLSSYLRGICKDMGVPALITLHGLNSFGGVIVPESLKRYERDCLWEWHKQNQIVSFVSTGCKNRVKEFLGIKNDDNLRVIPNFTNLSSTEVDCTIEIRKKYNLPADSFIILYIGNIGRNKNQQTFIRSILKMDSEELKNLYVLFLGHDGKGEESIADIIQSSEHKEHLIICGNIPKMMMPNYLSQGDATALISYSEGFGLSIIEGFRFGLPALAVADMDGVPDFYDKKAMVLLKDRGINTICDGIKQLRLRKWNKEYIKNYSMNFTGAAISKKYNDLYKEILDL